MPERVCISYKCGYPEHAQASGDSRSFLKVEIWKKIVGLTGLSIGFAFGLKGYLISLVITGIIGVLLNMLYTGKSLGITVRHQLLPLLPYLFIAVTAAFIVEILPLKFSLNFLNLIIVTISFFVLYLGSNYLFKTEGITLFFRQALSFFNQLKTKPGTFKNYKP